MNRPQLAGRIFANWTVLSEAGRTRASKVTWNVRCSCGKTGVVVGSNLLNGLSTSCGCTRADGVRRAVGKHGMSKSKVYRAWATMISRCHNPRFPKYAEYGARGISVCERWRNDFRDFLADMGERPSSSHTVDRIDVNGNYEPGNCRWATAGEQADNKRNTVRVTYQGRTKTLSEWSRETGISYGTLRQRLFRYGWSTEKALTERT